MPIEIKELIIKTEISAHSRQQMPGMKDKGIERMKKQLLEECKRIISSALKKNANRR